MPNFVGTEQELRKAIQQWNQSKIQDTLNGVQWVFNPPAGCHFGGRWDRQIRSSAFDEKAAHPATGMV